VSERDSQPRLSSPLPSPHHTAADATPDVPSTHKFPIERGCIGNRGEQKKGDLGLVERVGDLLIIGFDAAHEMGLGGTVSYEHKPTREDTVTSSWIAAVLLPDGVH